MLQRLIKGASNAAAKVRERSRSRASRMEPQVCVCVCVCVFVCLSVYATYVCCAVCCVVIAEIIMWYVDCMFPPSNLPPLYSLLFCLAVLVQTLLLVFCLPDSLHLAHLHVNQRYVNSSSSTILVQAR
jgi:hypothetical protein